MSSIESTLRRSVAELVLGKIDLRDFAVVAARALATVDSSDLSAEALAIEIELRLAEFSNGDWSREELIDLLRPIATNYTTGGSTIVLGSGTTVIRPQASVTRGTVGISPVAAHA